MNASRGLGTRVGELHVGRRTGSKAQRQSSTLEKINMVQNDRSRDQGQVSKYKSGEWGLRYKPGEMSRVRLYVAVCLEAMETSGRF